MGNTKTAIKKNTQSKKNAPENSQQEIEILYQKMGSRWFAFSLINGEVFVGSISPEELKERHLPFEKAASAPVSRPRAAALAPSDASARVYDEAITGVADSFSTYISTPRVEKMSEQ